MSHLGNSDYGDGSYGVPVAVLLGILVFFVAVLNNVEVREAPEYRPQEGNIQWDYEQCIRAVDAFYTEYPNYHYEGTTDDISIDFRVSNPRENSTAQCDFYFNRI